MLKINLDFKLDDILKVLLIGAHPDDIEIGCGGTILRLIDTYPNIEFKWIILCGNQERSSEAVNCAHAFMGQTHHKLDIKEFRDGFLPYYGKDVKEFFESLKYFEPNLILTHFHKDLHQDHRLASELTWNTFRNHLILEYEIPKYDGDLSTPNLYIPLEKEMADKKVELLLSHYKSQLERYWFNKESLYSLMKIRSIECHETNYAEGFYCRKLVL